MWQLPESGSVIPRASEPSNRANTTTRRLRNAVATALVAGALLSIAGCPQPAGSGDGDTANPFIDADGNSSFPSADKLDLPPRETLVFNGEIDAPADLDVFDLGQRQPGDHILIDVRATDGRLDAVAAVFDEREFLHAYNDDRSEDLSNLNPLIDFVIREHTGTFYLAVAPYAGGASTGPYEVSIQLTPDSEIPEPKAQVVFLDWAGGQNIDIPNVGTYDLPPFDATRLGPYNGRTEDMKDRVQQIVRDRFQGFQLILVNSDDNQKPIVPHTTVYFGGQDRSAFAIAEKIDSFNADPADDIIVFTEGYANAFSRTPSFEEMSTALGNTVAHEVGHLLGLVHTEGCESLMDATCSNDRLLWPQEFQTAPLSGLTFPVGSQPALEILEWILGFTDD